MHLASTIIICASLQMLSKEIVVSTAVCSSSQSSPLPSTDSIYNTNSRTTKTILIYLLLLVFLPIIFHLYKFRDKIWSVLCLSPTTSFSSKQNSSSEIQCQTGCVSRTMEHVEEEDAESDLHALKKLYGLLHVQDSDHHKHGLGNLDEKAKLVLKRLLDGATEQVFEAQSKVTQEQPSDSTLAPGTSKGLPRSNSIISSSNKPSRIIPSDIQNSARDLNSHSINACSKKRCLHDKRVSKRSSSTSDERDRCRKGQICNSCIYPSDKVVEHDKESDRGKKSLHKRLRKIEYIQSIMEPQPYRPTSSKAVQTESDEKRPHGSFNISEDDVAKAVQLLKANGLRDRHRDSNRVKTNSSKAKNAVNTYRHTFMGAQDGRTQKIVQSEVKSMLCENSKPVLDRSNVVLDRMVSQKEDRVFSQKDWKITMLDRHLSRTDRSIPGKNKLPSRVQGQDPNKMSIPSVQKTSQTQKPVLEKNYSLRQAQSCKFLSRMPSRSKIESERLNRQVSKVSGKVTQAVQTTTQGPTLLRLNAMGPEVKMKDQTSRINRVYQADLPQKLKGQRLHEKGQQKDQSIYDNRQRNGTPHRRSQVSHHQRVQSDVSISSSGSYSSSYSSWTTSCNSESEDYSLPRRMGNHHYVSAKSDMDSKLDPRAHLSRERSTMQYRRTSRSPISHPRRHLVPSTIIRADDEKIGRFRRFRNKLGIIFHHHHHHHHHGDSSQVSRVPSPNNNRSLWKHITKMLHHSSKKDQEKLAVKRVVKTVPRQRQHGYLHGLVDGLVRHMWHKKRSKPSKGGIKRLGKGHGSKKVVKKWHWWQKFYKHNGGSVRRVNSGKARVKLGFRAKRPPLPSCKRY